MKASVRANALNRQAQHIVTTVVIAQLSLLRELEDFNVQLVTYGKKDVAYQYLLYPT